MKSRRLLVPLMLVVCALLVFMALAVPRMGTAQPATTVEELTMHSALLTQTGILSTTEPVTDYLPLLMNHWPPPTWHIQKVDARRMFEDFTHRSLALDSQGRTHVVAGYDELYHIWHDGNIWQFEVVDAGPWVGKWASLALDDADHPHISYYDWDNTCLKYAYWDGGAWHIAAPDCEGNVGWDTHLVLDSDNHPHISYTKAASFSEQDLRYAHWDGSQWVVETIEAGNNCRVGGDNAIALDSTGRPHVSYNDSGPGIEPYRLKHAVRDGGGWITETLESGGFIGNNVLAIDNVDHLHVVYQTAETEDHLKYAYWNGASWQTETLFSQDGAMDGLSLALDANQRPHFSYYHGVNGTRELRYVVWNGATWQNEVADANLEGTNWMEATSLALDAQGKPHIAYYLQDLTLLRYAHKSGATWQTGNIDQGGVTGVYASLALDGADHPHIAYYEDRAEDLLYAAWDGAQWQITTVDTEGSEANDGSVSLALDANGNPHISYRDDTDVLALEPHGLKYAHWNGTTWQTQFVDQEGRAGRGSAIIIDGDGYPHISYYDVPFLGSGEDSVRYARWDGNQWQIQTVDHVRQTYIDSPTSLALDSANHPHIAYLDGENEDLKYARWDGGNWQVQTIDSAGDVGTFPSLALDSADRPHISYRDRTHDDLRYAHWDGAQWYTETVTNTGDVGYFTSLAVDNNDHPHITYYDQTNRALCYARWAGAVWDIAVLATGNQAGYYSSLVLDTNDYPHVAYQNHSEGDLEYMWFGP